MAGIGQLVEDGELAAAPRQGHAREVAADEAGTAGYDDFRHMKARSRVRREYTLVSLPPAALAGPTLPRRDAGLRPPAPPEIDKVKWETGGLDNEPTGW